MRRTALFVQARMKSTRLHLKMFRTLYKDKSILYMCLQAANKLKYTDKALLIPYGETKYFKDIADEFDFPIIEGPEDDVMERFAIGLLEFPNAELVQRVCADKVVFSFIDQLVALEEADKSFCDLTHYENDPVRSVTAGIYRASSLLAANVVYPGGNGSVWNKYREHIKPLFLKKDIWNINTLSDSMRKQSIDISINTEEDLKKMRNLFSDLYTGEPLDFLEVLDWFAKNK